MLNNQCYCNFKKIQFWRKKIDFFKHKNSNCRFYAQNRKKTSRFKFYCMNSYLMLKYLFDRMKTVNAIFSPMFSYRWWLDKTRQVLSETFEIYEIYEEISMFYLSIWPRTNLKQLNIFQEHIYWLFMQKISFQIQNEARSKVVIVMSYMAT